MNIIKTLCIASLFATIFSLVKSFISSIDLIRGVLFQRPGERLVAYVFIHLLPEMDLAGREFVKITADWSQI
jgi:hypothetical protein